MANQAFHDLYDDAVIKDDDVLAYARLKDACLLDTITRGDMGILLVEAKEKNECNC